MEALIELTITAPGTVPHTIAITRDLTAPPPLEPVDAAPFSHGFTGRHDGGALPPPGANHYSRVIDAVAEAKASTDAYVLSMVPAKEPPGVLGGASKVRYFAVAWRVSRGGHRSALERTVSIAWGVGCRGECAHRCVHSGPRTQSRSSICIASATPPQATAEGPARQG